MASTTSVAELPKPYTSSLRIAFPSERNAKIVMATMEVDEELQPTRITKELSVQGNTLVIDFAATDLKMLRIAMSSFFDMVLVSAKTLLEFDDEEEVAGGGGGASSRLAAETAAMAVDA